MTFPRNTPSIDQLINLPAGEIAQLPVELLAALQREIDAAAKQMKAVTARFSTALELCYAARAAEARHLLAKDTGTVRLVDGDFTVVADLPKRVEWDQANLAEMVERIRAAGEDPAEYVEISFKVPERAYVAWPELSHSAPPITIPKGGSHDTASMLLDAIPFGTSPLSPQTRTARGDVGAARVWDKEVMAV